MPLDPSIALQVKPVQIEAPDFSKTFLTLGQLKYLNAETLRAQVGAQAASEEAARKQTGFEEEAATNRYLSDLSRPRPVAPAPGGPSYDEATLGALPQGGTTPAPASGASAPTSPAQQQGPPPGTVNLFDPEIMAGMRRVAPHTFDAKFKALQEHATTTLNLQKEALAQTTTKIGLVSNFIGSATDQQSLDMGLAFLHQSGIDTAAIPTTWTPDLPKKISEWSRTAQQRVEQGQKDVELTENLVLKGITQDILVPRYPGSQTGPGRDRGGITQTTLGPGTPRLGTPVPGTERPLTAGEAQAKAHLDLATTSNARVTQFEDALARDPAHPETLNYANVSPNLLEDTASQKGHQVGGAVGGTLGAIGGGIAGGYALGPMGVAGGATGGATGGAIVGGHAGEVLNTIGNTLLSKERQQYYNEQLNFIAAVRGEETSRITRDVFDLERERFFPKVGDVAEEVLRKRQVRQEALSGMATQTNRPQGMTPVGQTHVTDSRYPQAPTGPPSPVARSPHADKAPHQLTRAQLAEEEAWLRKDLGR